MADGAERADGARQGAVTGAPRALQRASARPGALIIGASSGIGAALARVLVARGYQVALVARRGDELDALAQELSAAAALPDQPDAPPIARAYAHDVTAYGEAPPLFARIVAEMGPGNLSLVIYAAGALLPGTRGAWSFAEEQRMMETNLLGAIRWLDLAAEALGAQGSGTLVGISSVAGERGRRGNSAYQASKAALNTYLESLRYRLARRGVRVVTVKPGYVDTPMLAHARLPGFLVASPARVAAHIAASIEDGASECFVPGYWALFAAIFRHLPDGLVALLPL